jgi:hypothetical protein
LHIAFHFVNVARRGRGVNISFDKVSTVLNWIKIRYTLFLLPKVLKLW